MAYTSGFAEIEAAAKSAAKTLTLYSYYASGWNGSIELSDVEHVNYVGGSGNDLFTTWSDKATRVVGGEGTDALYADWRGQKVGVTWDLNATANKETVLANGWTVQGIDRLLLRLGDGDNRITLRDDGSHQRNVIYGDKGNDIFIAGGGNGADLLHGGAGVDQVSYGGSKTAVSVNLAAQWDNKGAALGDELISIENLRGSKFDDDLHGDAKVNTIWGGAGNDKLYGEAGDDVLVGGLGADLLNGGSGADRASYAEAAAAVRASLADAKINTGEAKGDSYVSIENLTGSKFNDDLRGDAKANSIWGGAGNDTVHGGAGNDKLHGESGNDRLEGGLGRDLLYGGAGKDIFVFRNASETGSTASTADVIMDFRRGQDLIDFSVFDANSSASGRQKFTGLIASEAAFTKAGQLRFDSKTNMLYGDTDGDADAEFAIKLQGVAALSNDDFIF